MKRQGKSLSLKNLTKTTVWDIQENDIFRLWSQAERDTDLKGNEKSFLDVIKSAFIVEEVKVDRPEVIKKYEDRGCKVGQVRLDDNTTIKWAIKKKPINRISDLTKNNIHRVSASKIVEVLEANFGGGWDSLPQETQDIILSAFEVTTTTLPTARLKKEGGLYDKKVEEGYEVLEISKGAWTEAIFVKEKTEVPMGEEDIDDFEDIMPKSKSSSNGDEEEDELPLESENEMEDDEDDFDEEKLIEESYRTTFEESPEDLDIRAEDISDEDF